MYCKNDRILIFYCNCDLAHTVVCAKRREDKIYKILEVIVAYTIKIWIYDINCCFLAFYDVSECLPNNIVLIDYRKIVNVL